MMKMILNIAATLLALSFTIGCATQRVYTKGDLTGPADYEETQTFWFGGIGQKDGNQRH